MQVNIRGSSFYYGERQPKSGIIITEIRKSFPSFWRRGGRDDWLSDFYKLNFPAGVVDLLVSFYLKSMLKETLQL